MNLWNIHFFGGLTKLIKKETVHANKFPCCIDNFIMHYGKIMKWCTPRWDRHFKLRQLTGRRVCLEKNLLANLRISSVAATGKNLQYDIFLNIFIVIRSFLINKRKSETIKDICSVFFFNCVEKKCFLWTILKKYCLEFLGISTCCELGTFEMPPDRDRSE